MNPSIVISQLVDKTNFNFDQLLLNGGGPSGPQGPQGPTGPAGGRGEKGSTWYEDTSVVAPGNTPLAVPPTVTPLSGDYYLQFNGDVWEYNGNVWVITTVNLEGPTGPAGVTGGFTTYFGQGNVPVNKNTIMVTPTGFGFGATAANEGIQTVLIGGVGSNAVAVDPTIPLTPNFQITDAMAGSLASDSISMLVHQKNSGTSAAIAFMGGAGPSGTNPGKYEQNTFANLSAIQLGIDDTLNIFVNKPATTPISNAAITGFNVSSPQRGQNYTAGGQILLTSGTNSTLTGFGGANGNIEILVKAEGGAMGVGNQLKMTTLGTGGSTQILAGDNGAIPINPGASTSTGNILIDANGIGLVSKNDEIILNSISSSIELYTNAGTGAISMLTNTGNIGLQTISGNITQTSTSGDITANTTTGDMEMITNSGNIDIKVMNAPVAGGAINITTATTSGTNGQINMFAGGPGPGTGGAGGVSIRSKTNALTLNAEDDADLNIQNNTKTRAKFIGGNQGFNSGKILLGGGVEPAAIAYTTYKGLVIIDSTLNFSGNTPTNTIQVGVSPTVGTGFSPSSSLGYNGGGEIVGPYATNSSTSTPTAPWSVENEGALHIRSNVRRGTVSGIAGNDDDTTLPGSIWVYPTTPTQTTSAAPTRQAGEWINGNSRIWGVPNPPMPFSSSSDSELYGIQGITIGLNALVESKVTAVNDYGRPGIYDPVAGRTFLYGQRAVQAGSSLQPSALDQNRLPISGTDPNLFGGVNVGDRFRGRQSFKVWGDYVGNYYVSEFGGIISGNSNQPGRAEQQCFLSGGQGFSNWTNNVGSNTTGQNIPQFKYKYQWQRVGRVVTGSGMIRHRVNTTAGTHEVGINEFVAYGGAAGSPNNNGQVFIGPIPFPVQVGNANTTDDPGAAAPQGVENLNISGVTTGSVDIGTGSNTIGAWSTNNSGQNSYPVLPYAPFGVGEVCGGNSSLAFQQDSNNPPQLASNTATRMWLKVYVNHEQQDSNAIGIIPGYIKFTFSYEVNP